MLIKRLQRLTRDYPFFLFGPRGSGKSTLLEELYPPTEAHGISFLDAEAETTYALNPNHLIDVVKSLSAETRFVVIDEVQKVPKILATQWPGVFFHASLSNRPLCSSERF
jgi:predicted AAA+ superfamily ATPase